MPPGLVLHANQFLILKEHPAHNTRIVITKHLEFADAHGMKAHLSLLATLEMTLSGAEYIRGWKDRT